MKAGQLLSPMHVQYGDAPEPAVGDTDVLIRVHSAGICGTDIHIFKGEYEATYPLIPGHEFSGTVAAVGLAVTGYRVGDRVTADPNIACGVCCFCQRNEPNQCLNHRAIGVTRDGGFAEYVTAPEANVFPIGDIPFPAAALIEPLACVVWGLKMVEIQPGDSVLLFGAGPMGCLLVQAVRLAGAARVVVVDPAEWRLKLAQELGASEGLVPDESLSTRLKQIEPLGFDVVADATGLPAVMESMFAYARPRGKIWIFGVAPNGAQASFPPYEVFRKDLRIIGSFAVNRTFPQAIALIRSGRVLAEPLISHQLPLAGFARGFNVAQHEPRRMKVQFSLP